WRGDKRDRRLAHGRLQHQRRHADPHHGDRARYEQGRVRLRLRACVRAPPHRVRRQRAHDLGPAAPGDVMSGELLEARDLRVIRGDREARAQGALARVGIVQLANRRARSLSGGEAQRVSIARAIAPGPDLLFLDEPFAGLDAPTRDAAIADLARAVRGEHLTAVLVTHDRDEALTLGDRVAVLLDGRVRQLDRPDVVFATPADPEVADFVGVE